MSVQLIPTLPSIHRTQSNSSGYHVQGGLSVSDATAVKEAHNYNHYYNHTVNTGSVSLGLGPPSIRHLLQSVPPKAAPSSSPRGGGGLPAVMSAVPGHGSTQLLQFSAGAAAEYASRFKARPTTQPSAVCLDSGMIPKTQKTQSRGMGVYFPAMKRRFDTEVPAFTTRASSKRQFRKRSQNKKSAPPLELVPDHKVDDPAQNGDGWDSPPILRNSLSKSAPVKSDSLKKKWVTYPPVYPGVMKQSDDFDDLTSLPRPMHMVSKGDVPWVYRHKVKKSMNELSKIMASKPTSQPNENSLMY